MAVRTGIITFQNANNYGAVLQAFALQRTLEKLGHDVSVINYDSPAMGLKRCQSDIFNEFILRNLNLTEEYHTGSDIEVDRYDLLITGSDQVWNPEITECDPVYFLDFASQGTKRVSYAASIGIEGKTLGSYKEFFETNLRKMDIISLREDMQKGFVSDITGKNVSINVDPTLLLDAGEYEKAFGITRRTGDHIFMYSNNADAKMLDVVNLLSLYTGMPVMAVSRMEEHLFVNGSKVSSMVRPEEWLESIASAAMIITDSFHGLMFSLIFERPFYIYTRKRSNISRITGVLDRCGLRERTLTDIVSVDNIDLKADFSVTRKLIEEERNKSAAYLRGLI